MHCLLDFSNSRSVLKSIWSTPKWGSGIVLTSIPAENAAVRCKKYCPFAPTMREPGPVGRLAVIAGKALDCGKNGTRGAIFHKRRLLGEYILAVCKAGSGGCRMK